MKSRILTKSMLLFLLSAGFCAVQPLAAGNTLKGMAAGGLLATAALTDPGVHQQMLGLLHQEYGKALGTSIFEAAQGLPDAPPMDLKAYVDWHCADKVPLFDLQDIGTEERCRAFQAHIDRERVRFASLAEASARKVAELERNLDRTGRRGATDHQDPCSALGPSKEGLALELARKLDHVYQSFHRLLQGVRSADLNDPDAIRKFDQMAVQEYQAATLMLGRETQDNTAVTKTLDLVRERAKRSLDHLEVRRRNCQTETPADQVKDLRQVVSDLGTDWVNALERTNDMNAAMLDLLSLKRWIHSGASRRFPEEEAREPFFG